MLFDAVLFSGLLFAFIAQAVPFGLAFQFTTAPLGVVYFNETDLTFSSIGAGIRIPNLKGNVEASVYFGIGFDIAACQYRYLQLGIKAIIHQDGTAYSAVYTDDSSNPWRPMALDISAGDLVLMVIGVNPSDMASASVVIENLTKGWAAAQVKLTRHIAFGNHQTCGHSPVWFVETEYSSLNVTVEFLHADANSTTEGMIYPNDFRAKAYWNSGKVGIMPNSTMIQLGST